MSGVAAVQPRCASIIFRNPACMFYTVAMIRRTHHRSRPPATLTLKVGQWLEANASGWGVLAVPVVLLLLLGAAALARGFI